MRGIAWAVCACASVSECERAWVCPPCLGPPHAPVEAPRGRLVVTQGHCAVTHWPHQGAVTASTAGRAWKLLAWDASQLALSTVTGLPSGTPGTPPGPRAQPDRGCSRLCCLPGARCWSVSLRTLHWPNSSKRPGSLLWTSHPWAASRVSRAQQPALAPSIHVLWPGLWHMQTGKRALDSGATFGTKVSSEDVGTRLLGRGPRVPFAQATILGLPHHARLRARLSAAAGGLSLPWLRTL